MKKSPAVKSSISVGTSSEAAVVPEIQFYRANEKPYGAFSNLFRRAILFEGHVYPTAEHAYQAGKARKQVVREWLLSAPTPGLVAMAAHGLYTWDIVPDWSRIKFDRMREVLQAKFTQHDDLKELLLSTGTSRLVEVGSVANVVNCTWGEVNGKGKNMLGVLLMELRAQLANVSAAPASKHRTTRRQVDAVGTIASRSRISGAPLRRGAAAITA
jgi:ribA/ribD-fused uncharacterized protein